MILDETMDFELESKIRISTGGDFAESNVLRFKPPTPLMAQDTFKLRRYFGRMQKDFLAFTAGLEGTEKLKESAEQVKLQAGGTVEAIHKEFADDADRDALLADIDDAYNNFMEILDICENVDFYQLTVDFGKMVENHRRCFIVHKDASGSEVLVPMTTTLWNQKIDPEDRLAVAIRYCCFFGLTSNTRKKIG